MIPGLNHNVRYRDRVFHVQTEDSGLIRSILTTHVFLDGSVIAHERSSYANLIDPTLEEFARNKAVKKLMQELHRSLLRSLVRGELDETLIRLGVLDRAAISQPPRTRITKPPASRPPERSPLDSGIGRSLAPVGGAQRFDATLVTHDGDARPTEDIPRRGRSSAPLSREAPAVPDVPLRPSEPPTLRSVPRISDRPKEPPRPADPAGRARSGMIPAVPHPSAPAPPGIAHNIDALPSPALFPQQRATSTSRRPGSAPPAHEPPTLRVPPAQQAAIAYGRTLIDAPPVLPPEIAAAVKRSTAPPLTTGPLARPNSGLPKQDFGSRPTARQEPTPRQPSIQQARTVIDPRQATRQRKNASLEHDTLLDLESPFPTGFDAPERRTDASQLPPKRISDVATARGAAADNRAPQRSSGQPVVSDLDLGKRPAPPRMQGPPPPKSIPGLLEDPTIEDALLGLSPIEEEGLDALDRDRLDPRRELRFTAPGQGGPNLAGPRPGPNWSGAPRPSDPSQSTLMDGGAWSNEVPPDRLAGSRSSIDRSGSGASPPPRSVERGLSNSGQRRAADRSGTGPQRAIERAPSTSHNSGQHRAIPPRTSGRPGASPEVPAWPPPDADLDQFVRQHVSLIPEPDDQQYVPTRDPPPQPGTTGKPIRVEERSLDDIILGYLNTKQKR